MMHLFVNTATSAAIQELDCLAISGLIRTKTLFNAYTMIFKTKGCLLLPWQLLGFQEGPCGKRFIDEKGKITGDRSRRTFSSLTGILFGPLDLPSFKDWIRVLHQLCMAHTMGRFKEYILCSWHMRTCYHGKGSILIDRRPGCIPLPSHQIYVAEQHEVKSPATGFWGEIYTVSAAGSTS